MKNPKWLEVPPFPIWLSTVDGSEIRAIFFPPMERKQDIAKNRWDIHYQPNLTIVHPPKFWSTEQYTEVDQVFLRRFWVCFFLIWVARLVKSKSYSGNALDPSNLVVWEDFTNWWPFRGAQNEWIRKIEIGTLNTTPHWLIMDIQLGACWFVVNFDCANMVSILQSQTTGTPFFCCPLAVPKVGEVVIVFTPQVGK